VLRAKELLVRSEAPYGVRDGCELFSLAGLEQGQEAILSLAKTDQVEVLAETRPFSRTEADDAKDRDRPIEGNRLYLVIHPSPVSVDVYVGAGLRGRGFNQERQARLRQVVEETAVRRNFDDGLLAGVRFVKQFEEEKAKAAVPAAPPKPD
jgi:hypothetical protein